MPCADFARLQARAWILPAALALSLAGCAAPFQAPPPEIVRRHARTTGQPPLKLCPVETPPKDIASRPGYLQLTAYVTDELGKPITGLKQPDFVVAGENQLPLPMVFFRENQGGAPTSIAVITDASGSMQQKLGVSDLSKLQMVWNGLDDVMNRLNECDEVATLRLGGRTQPGDSSSTAAAGYGNPPVKLVEPLTTDHTLALIRLADVVPYGRTPLYDSIHEGLQVLGAAHYPDRVLILITDGIDTSSERKKAEVLAEAASSGVSIYAIGLGSPSAPKVGISTGPFLLGGGDNERVDARTLEEFTNSTGGRTFIVNPVEGDTGATFLDALAEVTQLLAHSYSIGIVPPPATAAQALPNISLPGRQGARVNSDRAMPVAPITSVAAVKQRKPQRQSWLQAVSRACIRLLRTLILRAV